MKLPYVGAVKMYRILKVCRSIIKETELAIINSKGRGKGQNGGCKNSNTTEESYYYNQRRKQNELVDLVDINFENQKSCFATLTFADEIEYQFAVNQFKGFTKNYNAPRCQDTILKKISYRSFRVLMVKLPAHTSCNKRHPGIHHQWMSGACRCCIPAYSA